MGVALRLEFDRPDRTYRTGERVGGFLRVITGGGAKCKELRLTHSWEALGLGNIDRGFPPTPIPLPRDPFPTDSVFVLPFEFLAPKDPLSYHGRAISVVHYLALESDVSGDRDVRVTEKYLVVPGPLLGPPPTRLSKRHLLLMETLDQGKRLPSRSQIGQQILLPFLKRKLAELRLGIGVKARLSSQIGVPGDSLDVKLHIAPKYPIRVNGASVELRAHEVWVSGTVAQTNRTTNRKLVYSKVTGVPIPRTLGPESLTMFTASTSIPDKGLYSFTLEENALAWEAVVRVDVPLWPDWEEVIPLLVWPSEGLEEQNPPVEKFEVEDEPEVVPEPEAVVESEDQPTPPPSPTADPDPTLTEAVRAIQNGDIFGGSRDRLIKDLLGKPVSFDLTVVRVERTFAMYSDAAYRNGRTITGTVSEDGVEVRVWFPEVQNEVIDALKPGTVHPVSGTVANFDRLSLRPTVRAVAPPTMGTEQA